LTILGLAVLFQAATYTLPQVELPRYVSEESEIVWYPVAGSTVRQLQSQMHANGPRDDAGAYAGYTRNYTYWHIHWREGGGSCSLTDVAVATYDTVTLPAWTPPPNADSALMAEWSRFVTMLGRHEEGHRDIAIAGAGEIARTLAMLSPQASCADLGASANAQGHAILAAVRTRQKQYDDETNHGRRHGTALEDSGPPSTPIPSPIVVVAVVLVIASVIVGLIRSRAR
jgi:predicted secreted Zn-dependent protease